MQPTKMMVKKGTDVTMKSQQQQQQQHGNEGREIKNTRGFSTSSVLNSVAAGYIAGTSGVIVGHPFESAKVWLQTRTENQNKYLKMAHSTSSGGPMADGLTRRKTSDAKKKASTRSSGKKNMSTLIMQQEQQELVAKERKPHNGGSYYQQQISVVRNRLRALYSGATGPVVTVGLAQCINFAIYDSVRRVLHDRDARSCGNGNFVAAGDYLWNDSLVNVALAGSAAGSVLALFTAPLIKVKVQQQVTGNGFRQAFCETFFRRDSIASPRTIYRGFAPHFVMETAGRALYFTTYEGLKRWMTRRKNRSGRDEAVVVVPTISIPERMVCAASAGITSWSVFFPLDAVRSRLYAQHNHSTNKIRSCFEMARFMYYEKSPSGSLRAFYRGFGVTVVRAGPVAAAVLPIYDLSLKWLSSS